MIDRMNSSLKMIVFALLTILFVSCGQEGYAPNLGVGGNSELFAGTIGVNGSADGPRLSATFGAINGVSTDGTYMYVNDQVRMRRIHLATGAVTTLKTYTTVSAGFGSVYLKGKLYVTDDNISGQIVEIDPSSGAESQVAAIAQYAYGLATDGNHLYFSTPKEVFKMTVPGYVVTSLAGDGSNDHVDGPGATARFRQIFNLIYAEGYLWAADYPSYTLRRIDPNTGYTTTVAGADQQNSVADGVGTAARFGDLGWIGYHAGSIYTVDSNCMLRAYKISSHVVSSVAGQDGVCSNTMGSASSSTYDGNGPGISIGGRFYYASRSENFIRVID